MLPGGSLLEKDGTFVNFDRRFQRVRPALDPPGQALHRLRHPARPSRRRWAATSGARPRRQALAECAELAPLFAGISHERLDREGALPWPCRGPDDPGEAQLYEKAFATQTGARSSRPGPGCRRGSSPTRTYPYTLITGRRLVHYNAGTMTRRTPNLVLAPGEHLDLHPDDAQRLGVGEGDRSRSPAGGAR